jgi:hypothetical protein
MAKSKSRSITARCSAPAQGSADSAFIDAMYAIGDRERDHRGLTDQQPAPRKPYRDPGKFTVVDTAKSRVLREQLSWMTTFRCEFQAAEQAARDKAEAFIALRSPAVHVVHVEPREPDVALIYGQRQIEQAKSLAEVKRLAIDHAHRMAEAAAKALARAEKMA